MKGTAGHAAWLGTARLQRVWHAAPRAWAVVHNCVRFGYERELREVCTECILDRMAGTLESWPSCGAGVLIHFGWAGVRGSG